MAYDIRLVKLVNGDMVIGKYEEKDGAAQLKDAAVLQTVPSQQGVQMMLLPFGYPFDNEIDAVIDYKHVIYEYKKFPDDLQTKYLEAASNLTLSNPGTIGGMGGMGGGGNVSDLSELLKK